MGRCRVEKVRLQCVCCALTISIVDLLTSERATAAARRMIQREAHKSAARVTRVALKSATEVLEGKRLRARRRVTKGRRSSG